MGPDVRFCPAAMNCSHRFFSLEAFFASAADSGFEAVELWTGPMHFFLDYASNDTPEKITRLANSFGLDVCALCPEQNNPKPANIAARGKESIKRTKDYFLRAINVASELGVEIVVVTPGWGFLDEECAEAWKRSVYMLGDLSSYAACKGIVLAVEALQPEESNLCNRCEDLRRLIDEVGSSSLKALLDTGAMWRVHETIQDYFDAFGKDVVHCHFTDAGTVSHLAWGDGERNLETDLLALTRNDYKGYLSFEIVGSQYYANPASADRRSLAAYRRALEEIHS